VWHWRPREPPDRLCLRGTESAAQTGWFGSPNASGARTDCAEGNQPSTGSGDGECISVTAPDLCEYSESILPPEITVPSQCSLTKFAGVIATEKQRGSPNAGVVQAAGAQSNQEHVAQCVRMDEWLTADVQLDAGRASKAESVLQSAATWPATVSTDGGRIVASNLKVPAGAVSGDRTRVVSEVAINCGAIPDRMLKCASRSTSFHHGGRTNRTIRRLIGFVSRRPPIR
jgi:hypothetical protein